MVLKMTLLFWFQVSQSDMRSMRDSTHGSGEKHVQLFLCATHAAVQKPLSL